MPDLESEYVLFMNGEEVHKGSREPLQIANSDALNGIINKKDTVMSKALMPGECPLQLQIRDKNAKGKANTTIQSIQFEVIP